METTEEGYMISGKRKLWIMIVCKAFRCSDEKILDKFIENNLAKMNDEELEYALSLFD